MPTSGSFPLVGMISCMVLAQVLFKLAGNHLTKQESLLYSLFVNPWLWAGLLSSALGMILWVIALRSLPLSSAYPFTAFIYVLTPMASFILFKDVLTMKYLVGLSCVVSGVLLTTWGRNEQ